MVKLNLCSGSQKIPGYTNVDTKFGTMAYPLPYDDASADEIRCSHGLEHFAMHEIPNVLKDWVRVLKPGGILKIAVPDFEWCCREYLKEDTKAPIASYVLGGQQDEHDFHKALFDESSLTYYLENAGLTNIQRWESEIKDCATNPVSLNLRGTKAAVIAREEVADKLEVAANVGALMSVPRLGWQDNFGSCFKSLQTTEWNIPLFTFGGAFWEMGMQRGFNAMIEQGIEWIITIDYDTVFVKDDLKELLTLAAMYPDADAIVPIQAKRNANVPLFTMRDAYGQLRKGAEAEEFEKDLTRIHTGHFGLTLLKTEAIKKLKKPWFWSQPTPDGEWEEGRIDADIYFWQEAEKQGFRTFQANNIRIGHLQVAVSWVNKEFEIFHQYLSNYQEYGKPDF